MRSKFKFFAIFIGCFLFRLLPLRAPNLEPLMASIMPLGKRMGAFWAFVFGFFSIFIYDLLTHFGSWTWICAITYGLIGAISAFYFKKSKIFPERSRRTSRENFVLFAIVATIVYDLTTGVLFAPIFGQTMWTAFMLQIPFTALHLAGNIGFAFFLSPILSRWLSSEKVFSLKFPAKAVFVK